MRIRRRCVAFIGGDAMTMLEMFYAVCAVVGGSVFLVQFALMLLGFEDGDGDGLDVADDLDISDDISGEGLTDDHSSSWYFGVISFKTVIAALTFFGLAGLASNSAGIRTEFGLGIAVAAGGAAMYGVYQLMRGLGKLSADGTVRIERAVGHPATVYLKIPGERRGAGKVTVRLQNRTIEYQAMTSDEALPTGARVMVVDVIGPDTVEVVADAV